MLTFDNAYNLVIDQGNRSATVSGVSIPITIMEISPMNNPMKLIRVSFSL